MSKLEAAYRVKLVKKLKTIFPDCYILRPDPQDIQGIPDILILYRNQWAMLEVKRENNSSKRPNQDYYVNEFEKMSFAAFIYPEVEEEVLHALQLSFGVG